MEKIKLYKEEQVRKAHQNGRNGGHNETWYDTDDYIKLLTPIKLPSDEEVQDAFDKFYQKSNDEFGLRYAYMGAFEDGAKWVIEQIKQQADERTI